MLRLPRPGKDERDCGVAGAQPRDRALRGGHAWSSVAEEGVRAGTLPLGITIRIITSGSYNHADL